MPRIAAHRHLPPLSTVCPQLADRSTHASTAAGIYACLSRVLPGLRQANELPFYPIHEVARLAGVSYKTAQHAYRQLAAAGLLRVVRGSQTFLRGRRVVPCSPVRGCVAVPVWTPGFVLLGHWRRFFISLETELRQQELVADFIFYDQNEDADPEFAERVLAHRPDELFWFIPVQVDVERMRRIADMGVRMHALLAGPVPDFPGRWHRLSWERAQRQALRTWRHEGITTALLIQDPLLASETRRLGAVVQAAGLDWRVDDRGVQSPAAYLRRLGRGLIPRRTAIILNELVFAQFCRSDPRVMAELLRRWRVLMRESIDLPADVVADARVDRLEMDWTRVARVIARHMAEDERAPRRAPVTFEARWRPRVPATN